MSQLPTPQQRRPTKQDMVVVTATSVFLISVLSFVLHAICASLHTRLVVWLVLLVVLWLPTITILFLFPLSRWPVEPTRASEEDSPEGREEITFPRKVADGEQSLV